MHLSRKYANNVLCRLFTLLVSLEKWYRSFYMNHVRHYKILALSMKGQYISGFLFILSFFRFRCRCVLLLLLRILFISHNWYMVVLVFPSTSLTILNCNETNEKENSKNCFKMHKKNGCDCSHRISHIGGLICEMNSISIVMRE